MTTPISDVLNYFYTEFQSTIELPEGLVKQFLLKAIGEFELNLYPINYDLENEVFQYDLNATEMSLLGKIMYKHYLSRERDRILKLNNIVGKDISLTSMGASKSEVRQAYEDVVEEIERTFSRLKKSSFL